MCKPPTAVGFQQIKNKKGDQLTAANAFVRAAAWVGVFFRRQSTREAMKWSSRDENDCENRRGKVTEEGEPAVRPRI